MQVINAKPLVEHKISRKGSVDGTLLTAPATALANGELSLPTETVYGLEQISTVRKLWMKFFNKRSPNDNPLIVHVGTKEAQLFNLFQK